MSISSGQYVNTVQGNRAEDACVNNKTPLFVNFPDAMCSCWDVAGVLVEKYLGVDVTLCAMMLFGIIQ